MRKVERALISLSDKTGLEEFVKGLDELGVEILSTGGTAKKIKELGIDVRAVSDYTGFPEMLDGRVKTLHPKIHGGLLSLRDNENHMKQIQEHNIELIDMVVVNLYPFESTISKQGVTLEEAIENIDIGGPSMLRSAAKNYRDVAVICKPERYADILKELKENDNTLSNETLSSLAVDVFEKTSQYDKAIYSYLNSVVCPSRHCKQSKAISDFADTFSLSYKKTQDLRYGENPHQKGAFYVNKSLNLPGVSTAKQLQGKELSFNNIIDIDSAFNIAGEFDKPAASVIKHTNPCGAAVADNLKQAYLDGLDCDRVSAFGSIVGLNRKVDKDVAQEIVSSGFVECVIAPGYDKDALEVFAAKKNLRILDACSMGGEVFKDYDLKKVRGGLLVQDIDAGIITKEDLKVVTKKVPTEQDLLSLLFGWKIVKHVRSNAIVLCQGTKTVGIGAGQMSRVDSVIISVRKAGQRAKGATLASDAFFPHPDAIEQAAKAGICAIIQPGGSIKDADVIKAADDAGIAMVFTGMRHFKH